MQKITNGFSNEQYTTKRFTKPNKTGTKNGWKCVIHLEIWQRVYVKQQDAGSYNRLKMLSF